MLQDVVSICEKDKNIVFYDVFASRAQQKIVKQWLKNAQNRLPKACQTCASADTFRAAQTLDSPAWNTMAVKDGQATKSHRKSA